MKRTSTEVLGERVTMHDLRAGAITSAILGGVPLEAVSRFAGHAELSTTQESYHYALSENQGRMLARYLVDADNEAWVPLNRLPQFLGTSLQAAYRFYGSRNGAMTKDLPAGHPRIGTGRRQYFVRASVVAEHLTLQLLGKRRSRRARSSG